MRIQKRDGCIVSYEKEKITAVIEKANNGVEEKDRVIIAQRNNADEKFYNAGRKAGLSLAGV